MEKKRMQYLTDRILTNCVVHIYLYNNADGIPIRGNSHNFYCRSVILWL